MGVGHDHGLELHNGYVVQSSSFKLSFVNYLKILDKYYERYPLISIPFSGNMM